MKNLNIKTMKQCSNEAMKKGFGLLEVVISCGILIIFIAGAIGLARVALQNSVISAERAQAYLLAQEALEIVRQIRDTTWVDQASLSPSSPDESNRWDSLFLNTPEVPTNNNLKCYSETCYPEYGVVATDKWSLTNGVNGSQAITLNNKNFTRSIFMKYYNPPIIDPQGASVTGVALKVTAKVGWNEYNKDWQVESSTYITDWKPGY